MKERTVAEKPSWGRRLLVILAVCFVLFALFLPLVLTSQPGPSPTATEENSPGLVAPATRVRQVSLRRVEAEKAAEPAPLQIGPVAVGNEKAEAVEPSEAVAADLPAAKPRCCAPAKTCGVAACRDSRVSSCRTIVRTRCRPIRRRVVRCRRY